METIAVLSGAGAHRALLHAAGQAGVLADDGQRVAPALVDGALEHLARWSLLAFNLDGQTIIMHDLVTQVVRDWLACRQRLTAAGWAAASLPGCPAAEAVPLLEQNLARCERMLGTNHLRTLAARINLAAANNAAGRAG